MKANYFVIVCLCLICFINIIPKTEDQCYLCHQSLEDKASQLFASDIHFIKGISCADCHGGDNTTDDMDIAMSKQKGFIGVPKGNKTSDVCIRCHAESTVMKSFNSGLPTNQLELLNMSVHGKLSTIGGERIAQCITCHDAHGIRKVNDHSSPVYSLNLPATCSKCHSNTVFMRRYNPSLPVDQLTKYRTSVHGILNAKGDPKTADCVDCHGSHEIRSAIDIKSKVYSVNLPKTCSNCHSNKDYMKGYNIPSDQYEKYSNSVHGVALLKKNDPGAPACNDCHGNHAASPPGVESISKVCGTCHTLNADLFSSSPHKAAFDAGGFPECETCHGNRDIIVATNMLLGVDKDAVCVNCHTENSDAGYKAAAAMKKSIDNLEAEQQKAISILNEAEQKGMEVSEAKFKLRDVNQTRLEARTLVHSFDIAKFKTKVDTGIVIAKEITDEAKNSIEEFYFRRIGLGASVLVISLLALGLFLYIKNIER